MKPEARKWRPHSKADYTAAFEAVRSVIHRFDPYGLLEVGCPDDEFDSEIKSIVRQIDRIGSPQDARDVVARVLGASFDHERFSREACQGVGEELYLALKEGQWLE